MHHAPFSNRIAYIFELPDIHTQRAVCPPKLRDQTADSCYTFLGTLGERGHKALNLYTKVHTALLSMAMVVRPTSIYRNWRKVHAWHTRMLHEPLFAGRV